MSCTEVFDEPVPDRLNLDHLKKQAKQLIRLYRSRDTTAMARFRSTLPATAGLSDEDLSSRGLRLHDAQSCIAREHGFASWPDLKRYVEVQAVAQKERAVRVLHWAQLVYSGDVSGTVNRANPRVALRMLADDPDLARAILILPARSATNARCGRQRRPIRHGSTGPAARCDCRRYSPSRIRACCAWKNFASGCIAARQLLIAAGADVNQHIHSRWPPGSLSEPDQRYPLSTLYGAAGSNHDPALTRLLLDAGANPNDGESLYHSLENPACTRLLLEHGARIAESNAIYRAIDLDDDTALKLLLEHGGDPNEPARNPPLTDWGSPLAWAIYRRRPRHAKALLDAGADALGADRGWRQSRTGWRCSSGFPTLPPCCARRLTRLRSPTRNASSPPARAATKPRRARLRDARPDLPASLSPAQLRLLPDMAAEGADDAVKLMVSLGWPIAVRGGDWDGSALNLAVFRGDAGLTRFLLEHGAKWTEQHGYGDNACGSLSWASLNEPVDGGDWVGCARALLDHGMPGATIIPDDPEWVLIAGVRKRFSDEVTEELLG